MPSLAKEMLEIFGKNKPLNQGKATPKTTHPNKAALHKQFLQTLPANFCRLQKNIACLKGDFAKGCFLAFDVLWGEAPFVLSRFLGAFLLSPIEELLTQTPRRRKVLKAPSGKNTL